MFGPLAYLCDASDRDGDPMASVDLVTLHIQGQGVKGDPGMTSWIWFSKSYCDYFDGFCDCDVIHNLWEWLNFCITIVIFTSFVMVCTKQTALQYLIYHGVINLFTQWQLLQFGYSLGHIAISLIFWSLFSPYREQPWKTFTLRSVHSTEASSQTIRGQQRGRE